MDHKRIEWLFLIIFVLIDVYLAVEILRSPVKLSDSNNANVTNSNIRVEMRADGIDLPENISNNQASGYYLAAKNNDYLSGKISSLTQVNANYSKANNSITATPKSLVKASGSDKEIMNELNQFKDNPANVPYGKDYHYEANMSSEDNYTFVQTSEFGSIYDTAGQLTITIKNGAIDNYTLTYMGPITSVRELQPAISPWHAIKAMYTDRDLVNNSRVNKIKLGYSKLIEVRGSTIMLPTWLVWVESKNTKNVTLKRVNAFTGQVLQTNASYNMEK